MDTFYRILDQLAARLGGPWHLRDYPGSSAGCPPQGVYFFCEDSENRADGEQASQETAIEHQVSRHIGAMPFLWLNVPGQADRSYLESNTIALLSCLADGPDLPSPSWLGHYAERAEIRQSGLWNVQHVTGHYQPGFLQRLADLADQQEQPRPHPVSDHHRT